jgi:Spx/MgsR family transcriptional regulator
MITLYGIPNCDTVKKARNWLEAHGVAYAFHDYKKLGIDADRLAAWTQSTSWEKLLNRQGTTWRKLDASQQAQVVDAASAIAAMQGSPSLIKRPVLELHGKFAAVGFSAEQYAGLLP